MHVQKRRRGRGSPYLFPPVVQLLLGILEHLLAPQIEEVIRIRVELQPVLTVLPESKKESQLHALTSSLPRITWHLGLQRKVQYVFLIICNGVN